MTEERKARRERLAFVTESEAESCSDEKAQFWENESRFWADLRAELDATEPLQWQDEPTVDGLYIVRKTDTGYLGLARLGITSHGTWWDWGVNTNRPSLAFGIGWKCAGPIPEPE